MLHHLLNGRLQHTGSWYNLYLSQRGNNSLNRFQEAVEKALAASEAKNDSEANYKLEIVPSKEMPELSIIDYLMCGRYSVN